MSSMQVRVAGELAGMEIGGLDAGGAQRALALARQLEGWLAGVKVAAARRLDQLRADGVAGRVEVTTGRLWGKTEARHLQRRSDALLSAPAVEALLAEGRITTAHVDAFAAAAAATPTVVDHQAELAASAAELPPDEFAAMCQRMAFLLTDDNGVDLLDQQRRDTKLKRWVDRHSGMYRLSAELDPERGAQLWAALDTEIERHFHSGANPDTDNNQRAAIALHTLTTRTGGGRAPSAATVHVHIDLETLVDGLRRNSTVEVTGGGTLPVDTIRRMACDADIIPYVLNSDGVVIDVGREKRLATRRQRHALRAMYSTCAFDGCGVRFEHTRIHHIAPFETGGPTNLHNLLPLCDRHHHDVHEGRWRIHLDPHTRELQIHRPDGTHHSTTEVKRRCA